MDLLFDAFDQVRTFLFRGGEIVVLITWIILLMWALIIERAIYLRTSHRCDIRESLSRWEVRGDQSSWYADSIYRELVSNATMQLRAGIAMIQTLAAVCPLLGLLGTVTGMILIFDAMSFVQNVSPRAVAAGVSEATISTMAGMVGAITGVFGATILGTAVSKELGRLRRGEYRSADIHLSPLSDTPRWARMSCAFVMATGVTFGILVVMQGMIVTGEQVITQTGVFRFEDFIRVRKSEEVWRKELKPEKPAVPEETPTVDIQMNAPLGEGAISIAPGLPKTLDLSLDADISGMRGFAIQDADYLPIVKVLPIYPERALVRGLSGSVLLRFTITTTGAVADVEVVESTAAMFEQPAIQAVLKFKYKPRIIDGVPVEVHGVLHRVTFNIEQDEQD